MKALKKFAQENNLVVIPITYKAQGIRLKRKGFDLCKTDGKILMTFEPVNYNYYPEKWRICNTFEGCKLSHTHEIKRITYNWLKNNINVNATSYYINKLLIH